MGFGTKGVTEFLKLDDTPESFSGQAGKVAAVNTGEDALEFGTKGVTKFLKLDDTPESFSGQAGKVAAVNTGEDALEFIDPPEHSTWGFASLQAQTIAPAILGWREFDLSKLVPEGAKGVSVRVINLDPGQERRAGLRKAGTSYDNNGDIHRDSWTSAIVGLSSDYKIEAYREHSNIEFLIQGYAGEYFEFLDSPVDVTPATDSVWTETDLSSYGSGVAGIFELYNITYPYNIYGYRKHGSSEDIRQGGYHSWFICPLDGDNKCDLYSVKYAAAQKIYLVGFVKSGGLEMYDTKQTVTTINDGTYRTLSLAGYKANPILAIFELISLFSSNNWAIRKNVYDLDVYLRGSNHNQCFLHPNTPDSTIRYKLADGQTLYLVGII